MAPPSKRRSGFSRKAQYGLFLGYVVAVGGVLLAVLMLILAIVDPRGFSGVRGAALDATTPVTSGGRSVVRFFSDGTGTIGNYLMAASQNEELKRRLAATRQKMIEARAIEFENQRLKAILGLRDQLADEVAVGRIVGSSFDSGRRLGTLSVGAAAGVKVGQPVRGAEGLIGRILETGRYASRVLLISDGSSNVPVQLIRDGTPALATGRGDGTVEIKPLELGINPFKRGDILVTSGTGGIYPPNVPVAIVARADRDITIARPIADPARMDFAIVQQIFQPAANRPLIEAAPPPAAPPGQPPAP
jgi:rod shape-determining protein MreC